jgi:S-formylglutathione hydrolase FrmB
MGLSSSGTAAFTMAWFHPELYHRVLAYSPTMVNQQWPWNPSLRGGACEYHDEAIIAEMKRIGIEPSKSFDFEKASPAVRMALEAAPAKAQRLIEWKISTRWFLGEWRCVPRRDSCTAANRFATRSPDRSEFRYDFHDLQP